MAYKNPPLEGETLLRAQRLAMHKRRLAKKARQDLAYERANKPAIGERAWEMGRPDWPE